MAAMSSRERFAMRMERLLWDKHKQPAIARWAIINDGSLSKWRYVPASATGMHVEAKMIQAP
jgi:hypothetical protein